MRIVGGRMRGRPLRAPKGTATRPTTDRVREAVFSALSSVLGSDLGEAVVLDAFAGSGALGLEALSRGAVSVTFVERDRRALDALKANIASFGVADEATVVVGDAFSLANRGILRGPFSLILLDPPYTLDPSMVAALLETLAARDELEEGCIITWESAAGAETCIPPEFEVVQTKTYGSTEVAFASYERGAGTE